MDNKEEYICGIEELYKAVNRNENFLLLHFFVFILAVCIPHSRVFLPCFLACLINFVASMWDNCKGGTDEACSRCLRKEARNSIIIIVFFSIVAVFNGCRELLKEGFNTSYIPSYILFVFNILLVLNSKSIYIMAGDVSKRLEYKVKAEEELKNASNKVANILNTIEHMFDGLEYEEKNILRPCVLKIQELFMLSYDTLYNIKNPNMFYDIESFILRYAKTIQAYRKGKGVADLDFLRRLNNSAEELYFALNSKEQALKKNDFDNKIEMIKIKLNNTWKGAIFYEK